MKNTIIILHGWQSNTNKYRKLISTLSMYYRVILPDLPGFGTNKITKPFSLNDYVNWLEAFIQGKKIKNPVILAHSFGGRVALKFAYKNKFQGFLILVSSAGIKPKLNLKIIFGYILAKIGNFLFFGYPLKKVKKAAQWILYKIIREKDYYLANNLLKQTMKLVLKEDLKLILPKIKAKTLLLWGEQDKQTPLENAYLMVKLIPKSKLVTWKTASHSLPFEKYKEVVWEIQKFIKS